MLWPCQILFRGHLKLAQQVCDELGVLASSVTGVDMELKTEASLRNARTLLAANQFSEVWYFQYIELPTLGLYSIFQLCGMLFPWLFWHISLQAAAVAHSLFCMCYKFNMQVENASVLLLLAEIHKVQFTFYEQCGWRFRHIRNSFPNGQLFINCGGKFLFMAEHASPPCAYQKGKEKRRYRRGWGEATMVHIIMSRKSDVLV